MEMRRDILLEQKVYENLSEFENEKMILQNPDNFEKKQLHIYCLLYTSPSPRDDISSRMPSSA